MLYRNILVGMIFSFISTLSFANNAIFIKSYAAQSTGDLEKAADFLSPMVEKNNEFALMRYAYLQYLQGKYNESIQMYEQVIKINPTSIDAKLAITLPFIAQKRWRRVKHQSLQILKLSHWNYVAHVRLMIAEEGLHQWKTLESHAKNLARVYPTDIATLVYLARANAWQGKTDKAKAVYKKVLNRSPAHIEAMYYLKIN